MDLKDLQNLKDTLSKIDQKNNQLIGAQKAIMKTFKEEYGLTTIKEVKEYLKKKKEEANELEEEINEETRELIKDLKKEGVIEDGED